MSEQPKPETRAPDASELTRLYTKIAQQGYQIVSEFLKRQVHEDGYTPLDPRVVGAAFFELLGRMAANPAALMEAQLRLWRGSTELWTQTARRWMGEPVESAVAPAAADKRFKDRAWEENPLFDFIKQSYLLVSCWLQSTVHQVEGLDEKTRKKIDFYTRQFVNAMAPTNFLLTNPEALRKTVETGGENLLQGLSNMLADLERGRGRLDVKMTRLDEFKLGENIAMAPGKVVYQNELMQLIQYAPTTAEVYRRPLLVVPPWINKFYILDLRPENSFVKWAVDQGHTVFMISWVNPDTRLAAKDFEDYMADGPLAALDAIEQATGEREANAIGYCIGGTLLASTLGYMAVGGNDRIRSATLLTSMTDFADVGEIEVFIDEEQLALLDAHMQRRGYFESSHMGAVFSLLRENDLIWSFVVNNYLLGKEPLPFDLLYWNSDTTRMPAAMHSFYIRNMYHKNLLQEAGGIALTGVPIDLRQVKTPLYLLSTREDHIAPWKTTYRGTRLFSGPIRFVLAASGHVAGVVNPPARKKYSYWTNSELPEEAQAWLACAQEHAGSWWPDWAEWVSRYGGERVSARMPGSGRLAAIEDAPGSYVRIRATD